jgi:AcrR family transcriptional regulator
MVADLGFLVSDSIVLWRFRELAASGRIKPARRPFRMAHTGIVRGRFPLFHTKEQTTMARTRAPDHETQRDQILELAAAKFAQTSYPSTSMADLAAASGTSKARLYHYYASKEAILFDLLDRYTKRLMLIIAEVEGASQRRGLTERETFAELIRAFLSEYENSHSRHVALLNDVKYLVDAQRE